MPAEPTGDKIQNAGGRLPTNVTRSQEQKRGVREAEGGNRETADNHAEGGEGNLAVETDAETDRERGLRHADRQLCK